MADDNRQWLHEIAHETGTDLLRFLRSRMSNAHDAEDLAQEVYMRLLRVKDTRHIENRRAYVLRVAANVAYEWRLLARNRLVHTSKPLEFMIDAADTTQEAVIKEQMQALESALHTLTPKCRAVVLMHRRDQYTYQEIAERMGISVSMVKKYLVKGLSVCQARLSQDAISGNSND